MTPLSFIFRMWTALYDPQQDPQQAIETYLHQDYEQCINGVILDRNAYLQHVKEQRKNLQSVTFNFKHVLAESDKLFILYDAHAITRQDTPLDAEIIAYFEIKDGKIFRIHGQVHLFNGTPEDVDMKPLD